MKLEGKWYVSVYDDAGTSTYPEASEVEILEFGNWVRFKTADGRIRLTSYPVNLRTDSGKPAPERKTA
jgi:hypothetical protein